ncbi:hypothetical protein BLNAU_3738 [Blattamonas nauphoetae]|uniref:RRM domain-containing protein n=1 Tax=Blattamonas nauphoetae TaxID=2049346 RepID=A0ABQ9YC02_9EUKA|nr:hypothetical protein BLNAU_3738 [Blattamonas nauphoetae]
MSENKVYVGNLSLRTNVDQLKAFFETVAPVEHVLICSKRGRSLRFGFVDLQNSSDRDMVCAQLNGKSLNGFNINVVPYTDSPPKSDNREPVPHQRRPQNTHSRKSTGGHVPSKTTIRVLNLPTTTTQEDLTELFKDFGVDFVICRGYIRGGSMIAFVHFRDEEGQQAALKQQGSITFHGVPLHLEVALERETQSPL